MRTRQFGYLLAILAAIALVATSVLMPAVLLTRDKILDTPSTVSVGNQPNEPTSKSQTPTVISTQQQVARVTLFLKGAEGSTLSSDSSASDMGMEDAVKTAMQRITDILDQDPIPALANFPKLPYTIDAELRKIGDLPFHYWNIFITITSPDDSATQTMMISLDAQTGLLFSLDITASSGNTINLLQTARTLAQDMKMQGKALFWKQDQTTQLIIWKFNTSELIMNINLSQKDGSTFLEMRMNVNQSP
jgi:hypothetical protein